MWWMANSVLHELALGRARACVRAPTKPHDAKMRWAGWPIRGPLIIAGTDLAARWKSWKATWGISQGSSELVSPCHFPLDHQETAAPQHFQGTLLVTILGDVLLPGMTDNVMEGMLFKESWGLGCMESFKARRPRRTRGGTKARGTSRYKSWSISLSIAIESTRKTKLRRQCELAVSKGWDHVMTAHVQRSACPSRRQVVKAALGPSLGTRGPVHCAVWAVHDPIREPSAPSLPPRIAQPAEAATILDKRSALSYACACSS